MLAQDIYAKDNLPPFPASVKDGYAVRGETARIKDFTLKGVIVFREEIKRSLLRSTTTTCSQASEATGTNWAALPATARRTGAQDTGLIPRTRNVI